MYCGTDGSRIVVSECNRLGSAGELPKKGGRLTPQERVFIDGAARTGDEEYAARRAGYVQPKRDAWRLRQRPAVVEEVRRQQMARLNNELLPLALDVIQNVLTDPKSSERGRLQAAKIVVDQAHKSGEGGTVKEPHEMTVDELTERIDQLRREAVERARPVIEGTAKADVFG